MSDFTMNVRVECSGADQQQIDARLAQWRQIFEAAGKDAKIIESSHDALEWEAIVNDLPIQIAFEDAEKLRGLLRDMLETSPGPARLALEIVDAAILLR